MSEHTLQIYSIIQLLCCVIFASLYAYGGMIDKRLRRIVGAVFVSAALITFSVIKSTFSWFFLFYPFLLFGALSLGYGVDEDDVFEKIAARLVYALAISFTAIPIAVVTGNYLMWGLHTILNTCVIITLGVWNPVKARIEELIIGLISVLLVMFMV